MCLPLTSRTGNGRGSRSTVSATVASQGPAALTSTRAVATARGPRALGTRVRPAARVDHQRPFGGALGPHAAGAGADGGAVRRGVERVRHDQAGIVDRAVGILEAVGEMPLERRA